MAAARHRHTDEEIAGITGRHLTQSVDDTVQTLTVLRVPDIYIAEMLTKLETHIRQVRNGLRDLRPHSRACGARPHEHGSACSKNCPTCGGK